MAKSMVSIIQTPKAPTYGQIYAAVERAVGLVGGMRDFIRPGQMVLVNPSWVSVIPKREQAAITLPEVTRAVANIIRDVGARPIIAESSAIGVDSERVIAESGYQELRDMGYEVVDLKKTEITTVPVENGRIFKEIQTYKLVKEVDAIIPAAKLKTHDQMELTLAIKKLKGLLTDKYKREFHQQGVFEACVDWYDALRPPLSVVDAIYCQEGLGPVFGKPVEMDLIVAGYDAVAVDAVCGYITGFDPEEVPITLEAAKRGLGVAERGYIEVVGESIESVRRRFMRVLEDERIKIEEFDLIYGEATCTGCRMGIMSSLFDMKEADQLMYLPGITVVTGDPEIPETISKDGLVTVGRCVPKGKRSNRHVKGCPPNNQDIVQAIIGGRAKAERHWE
ncbi:MAG: DUF362 domain-containing protein [Deltaproteobacteria bacterium]|nr:MAG: DUF362 domain-containing protein [Deltaproteobacteria bacterium]